MIEHEHAPDSAPHPARRHGEGEGGWLRPAVFGVSDGLVSNLALVLGVAAGAQDERMVLLAGISGLLAGAASMAAGEWVSVQAERERREKELRMEAEHIRRYPEEEAQHMLQILAGAGVPEDVAARLVGELADRPEANLGFHARVELGIDPDNIDSPWVAAGSSFAAFVLGAAVPLLPWMLLDADSAWTASVAAGGVALFIVGAVLARFTDRAWWWSGLRQLGIGGAAAAATSLIGALIGG